MTPAGSCRAPSSADWRPPRGERVAASRSSDAGVGEAERAGGALDEADADGILEPRYPAADRRLGRPSARAAR